jgi:hypothetical protein
MTPERQEEIKAMVIAMTGGLWSAEYEMMEQATVIIPELSAALEEAQQQNKDSVSHSTWIEATNGWAKSEEMLAEAQQTIARLTAALIAERDDALTWDGIGTVNRINKALGETQP